MKPEEKNSYTPTEVGTLIEQFRSEFKVFGERQQSIIEKQQSIIEKLDATYEQVGKNTQEIALIKTTLRNLKEQVSINTGKIEENRQLIEHVLEELKLKASREEFKTLKNRVDSSTS